MNGALSSMLGRSDLAPSYNAVVISSDGTATPVIGGPMISGNLNTSVSGSVGTGQVGLGLIAAGIVTLLVFYAVTRGIQR